MPIWSPRFPQDTFGHSSGEAQKQPEFTSHDIKQIYLCYCLW